MEAVCFFNVVAYCPRNPMTFQFIHCLCPLPVFPWPACQVAASSTTQQHNPNPHKAAGLTTHFMLAEGACPTNSAPTIQVSCNGLNHACKCTNGGRYALELPQAAVVINGERGSKANMLLIKHMQSKAMMRREACSPSVWCYRCCAH